MNVTPLKVKEGLFGETIVHGDRLQFSGLRPWREELHDFLKQYLSGELQNKRMGHSKCRLSAIGFAPFSGGIKFSPYIL
ncbi:hypothetical protein [Paenibacillus barengoltzii]|uniref:hypothetical protein n=1 Tax=Paenibacillus barengoltzii TaxID=343517 RepID=UPI00111C2011|nr:hypothetical protein [Paenibacillus barengoltzii]